MKIRTSTITALCAVGAGCAAPSTLPTFTPTGVETTYVVQGRLEKAGGCVQLSAPPGRYTVVWPEGSRFEVGPPERIVLPDGAILILGDEIALRGGEIDAPPGLARCGAPVFQTYGRGDVR